MSPNFDNIFSKVKNAAQQAGENAGRLAKIGKLNVNKTTLLTEKKRHLETIGLRAYTLYTENNSIDGKTLTDKIRDEIAQIERIEQKVRELESEIADLQAQSQHVDVTVADEPDKSAEKAEKKD